MKIKLDENMPVAFAVLLRHAGNDAMTVSEEGLAGIDDSLLLATAHSEKRLLITFDSDFGDIRNYPVGTHSGIVVCRLADQRWAHLKQAAEKLLDSGVLERLSGGLAVVDEARIRIRSGNK